ncbi:MAG TPA: hypothetical protein VGT03_15560 [Candidatus Acidoferrales bacterium]|nr:hypothetical protein [Candidatus Acidoferrales bacterium]
MPVNMADVVAEDAPAGADKTTFCAVPGAIVRAVGVADTPEDNPVTCTETGEANPLTAVTDTTTGVPPPGKTVTLLGAAVSEKSGVGGGGGGC